MGADDLKRTALVMSWSGGKDSALALDELRRDPRYEVVAIMTSLSEEFRRVSHHGVREELLEAQAEAIGVPLTFVYDGPCFGRPVAVRVITAFLFGGLALLENRVAWMRERAPSVLA